MAENDTLGPKERRALAALLTEQTVTAAAHSVGMSRKTLYRYLAMPAFQASLAVAQGDLLRLASARLALLLGRALDVIGDALSAEDLSTNLRAAALVLGHGAQLMEYAGFEQRLAALEARLGNEQGKA